MIISGRIFYVMEQKNITQLELSRRTGIATSNISDWKKKKTNPKADCLLSICDALDITPEQLLTGKGIDPEYKDADMDYEVTRADIKILKQIHRKGFLTKSLVTDFQNEYPSLRIKPNPDCHDRLIVLDYGEETELVYHCGASSKDAGKKLCAINQITENAIIHPVIDRLLLLPDKQI